MGLWEEFWRTKLPEKKEVKPEVKPPPLEVARANEFSAIRIDGTVVAVPEDTEAYLVVKKPGMFGLGVEYEVKPLSILTPEQMAEVEKAERIAEKKVEKVEVPKVVEVPKPVEVKKFVSEEELTPEEIKRLKPQEFEEEEIPPERRGEFRENLGKIINAIKEKAVPKIKEGIKKLSEIGKTTVERIRGWLKKIGICTEEVEKAVQELIEEEEKGRIPEKEVLASKEKTLSEEVL
jgi:hypothetical protein